jgi:hypothetical protein
VFDIILSEDEKYKFFYIGMKMKTRKSFAHIDTLCCIYPCRHYGDGITDIIYDDRYECPDHDTSEDKYDDIYTKEAYPCWDTMRFSFFDERIDEYSDKSCYHQHEDKRRKRIEHEDECSYQEKDEYFSRPKSEFCMHRKNMMIVLLYEKSSYFNEDL